MGWDEEERCFKESGVWQFDSKGATKALELMGKQIGMFESKVNLKGDIDFSVMVNYGNPPPEEEKQKIGYGEQE